jgi:hypothetical protein
MDDAAARWFGGAQKLRDEVAAQSQAHKARDMRSFFLNKLQPLQRGSALILPNLSALTDMD